MGRREDVLGWFLRAFAIRFSAVLESCPSSPLKNALLNFVLSAAAAPGLSSRAQRPRGRFRGLDYARLAAAEMALSPDGPFSTDC